MAHAATRRGKPQDFDYPARARQRELGNKAYGQLWPIVDGAVADALKSHPDYLTAKGQRSARTSIVKRVTGTVIGFAEQSAKGRVAPAEREDGPVSVAPHASGPVKAEAGAGAAYAPAHPHCRIGKVTMKAQAAQVAKLESELFDERAMRLGLESIIERLRRPRRETRKDAGVVASAKRAKTAQLKAEMGRG